MFRIGYNLAIIKGATCSTTPNEGRHHLELMHELWLICLSEEQFHYRSEDISSHGM